MPSLGAKLGLGWNGRGPEGTGVARIVFMHIMVRSIQAEFTLQVHARGMQMLSYCLSKISSICLPPFGASCSTVPTAKTGVCCCGLVSGLVSGSNGSGMTSAGEQDPLLRSPNVASSCATQTSHSSASRNGSSFLHRACQGLKQFLPNAGRDSFHAHF